MLVQVRILALVLMEPFIVDLASFMLLIQMVRENGLLHQEE